MVESDLGKILNVYYSLRDDDQQLGKVAAKLLGSRNTGLSRQQKLNNVVKFVLQNYNNRTYSNTIREIYQKILDNDELPSYDGHVDFQREYPPHFYDDMLRGKPSRSPAYNRRVGGRKKKKTSTRRKSRKSRKRKTLRKRITNRLSRNRIRR